jgi:hypothetical protein
MKDCQVGLLAGSNRQLRCSELPGQSSISLRYSAFRADSPGRQVTAAFDAIFAAAGMRIVKAPVRVPRATALTGPGGLLSVIIGQVLQAGLDAHLDGEDEGNGPTGSTR